MLRSIIVSIALLVCFWGNAQFEKGVLWKWYGNDLKDTSYIFGTMHVYDGRIDVTDPFFIDRIKSVEGVSAELIMAEISPYALIPHVMMDEPDSLQDFYSKEGYQIIQKRISDKFGGMGKMLERMKPIFLSMVLEGGFGIFGDANREEKIVDEQIQQLARDHAKELVALEKIEDQLKALNVLPLQEQADLLLDLVKKNSEEGAETELEKLKQCYIKQDLICLQQLSNEFGELNKEMANALLKNRNTKMAARMISLSHSKVYFHTFGAGHLNGADGILNLLVQQGYQLEQVEFEFE